MNYLPEMSNLKIVVRLINSWSQFNKNTIFDSFQSQILIQRKHLNENIFNLSLEENLHAFFYERRNAAVFVAGDDGLFLVFPAFSRASWTASVSWPESASFSLRPDILLCEVCSHSRSDRSPDLLIVCHKGISGSSFYGIYSRALG